MMASVVHHGPFTTIGEAYTAIIKWIEANGYRCVGPVREVYLQPAANGSQSDPDTVTEIQFPVEKM
jgi:effector-binding domain-containing protein